MGKELVGLRMKYRMIRELLDERSRRVWAAAEASSLPRGGVSLVAQATGLSRTTIHAGIRELQERRGKAPATGRIRRAARPLVSYQTIIYLIANTRTTTGLKIKAKLTQRTYPTGIEISDSEMAKLNLIRDAFHGDWNYSLLPQ